MDKKEFIVKNEARLVKEIEEEFFKNVRPHLNSVYDKFIDYTEVYIDKKWSFNDDFICTMTAFYNYEFEDYMLKDYKRYIAVYSGLTQKITFYEYERVYY